MLDGITILYQEEEQILHSHINGWFFSMILVAFVVSIGIYLLFDELLDAPEIATKTAIIIWTVVAIFFGIKWGVKVDKTYETHYGVTVDDSVKQNEFNEKYEIIEQKGKFYIIKERTTEE